ncbi:hypothetical protein Uis4E_2209, partial [Bifidobacterium parmae]
MAGNYEDFPYVGAAGAAVIAAETVDELNAAIGQASGGGQAITSVTVTGLAA